MNRSPILGNVGPFMHRTVSMSRGR